MTENRLFMSFVEKKWRKVSKLASDEIIMMGGDFFQKMADSSAIFGSNLSILILNQSTRGRKMSLD